jgi:dolichol-phosphate mannosyltransferase
VPPTPSPDPRPGVSIVIPTYNERGRLADLVATLTETFARHGIAGELVVVDDNSPDGTGALADELATRYPVRVVHRAGKLGLGTAVIEGFAAAGAEVCGVMDADLSHPVDLLPRMLDAIRSGADFVIGSRYIAGGGTRDWPVARLLMSRVACLMARPVTPVRDATSGFFLLRREIAEGVRIQAGGFKICLELLVRGRASSVVEVPYVFVGRTVGESKMNAREASGYLRQLWDLYRFKRSAASHKGPRTYRRLPPGAGPWA